MIILDRHREKVAETEKERVQTSSHMEWKIKAMERKLSLEDK